ncbi:MAG: AI-2E family transporter [Bacilli bacterium]|nr:AI-2E family transporter [Bacilli bacterium]
MFKDKMNFKLLNILIFCLIIYLGIITFNVWGSIIAKIIAIIIPFIVSFAVAYAFYPIVRKLRKKGLSNSLSVTIVSASVLFIIFFLIIITVPLVYDQLVLLSQSIGEVMTDLSSKFEINLGDFQTTINNMMNNIIESAGRYVSDGTVNLVGRAMDFMSSAIIIVILSIYFLADMEKIRAEVKSLLLRNKKRIRTYEYVKVLDRELGQYLNGLAIFIGIQFVEYTLLFRIIGHPNWLLLGLLASITTVIPYFGGLITNIIAVILASVVSVPLFIATLVICLIFPNIDGYIISPRVYGRTNNINAMWTIFAVVAGGTLFGIVGIMVSLPVYIALNCTYKFFKNDILDTVSNIKDSKIEGKKKNKEDGNN